MVIHFIIFLDGGIIFKRRAVRDGVGGGKTYAQKSWAVPSTLNITISVEIFNVGFISIKISICTTNSIKIST